jgi:hypothetical protein
MSLASAATTATVALTHHRYCRTDARRRVSVDEPCAASRPHKEGDATVKVMQAQEVEAALDELRGTATESPDA